MQGSILARLRNSGGEVPGAWDGGGSEIHSPGSSGSELPLYDPSGSGPGESPDAHRRKKWHWVLLAFITVAFCLWIIHERRHAAPFDWKAFAAGFLHLNWGWVVAAAVVIIASYWVRAVRWAVMIAPIRPDASVWRLFKATAIGFTAVVLLGRPGEFVRPYLISLREHAPLSSQFAAWFLERICDLLAILLVFGFAVSQIHGSHARLSPSFRWAMQAGGYAVAVLSIICLVILVMLGRYSAGTRSRLLSALAFLPERHRARTERVVDAFLDGTASMQTYASVLKLSAYTVLEWLIILLCFVCLFRASPQTAALGLLDILIFVGFVAFGSVIQIPGVGGGVQIVSIVVLTEMYRIPLEVATVMAITIWITTFVAIVPIGLSFAFHEGLNWRKLRDLELRAVRAGSALERPGGESVS